MKVELKENVAPQKIKVGDLLVLENGETRLIINTFLRGYATLDPVDCSVALLEVDTIEKLVEGYPIKRVIPAERLAFKEL